MKASELRIGNIIQSGGVIGTVLDIGSLEAEHEQVYCECEESFEWFFKDKYEGVPITQEWLVKLGAEEREEGWQIELNEDVALDYDGPTGWYLAHPKAPIDGSIFPLDHITQVHRHRQLVA